MTAWWFLPPDFLLSLLWFLLQQTKRRHTTSAPGPPSKQAKTDKLGDPKKRYSEGAWLVRMFFFQCHSNAILLGLLQKFCVLLFDFYHYLFSFQNEEI